MVTTQNLLDRSERGPAMVAAPEEILLESTIAGMSVVDVSPERVRYLRASRDVLGSSEHCAVEQGLLVGAREGIETRRVAHEVARDDRPGRGLRSPPAAHGRRQGEDGQEPGKALHW